VCYLQEKNIKHVIGGIRGLQAIKKIESEGKIVCVSQILFKLTGPTYINSAVCKYK